MSTIRVAINGFGRIGRLVMRAILEQGRKDIDIIAINDLGTTYSNTHMLKYDSVHGPLNREITITDLGFDAGSGLVRVYAEPNPEKLPWGDLKIDIVFECSGRFTTRDKAVAHIDAGAARVLVSAPCTDADYTVVYGINHKGLNRSHVVISNASCTTNCLAPIAHVLDENIGIQKGFMTTVHAYTGDQRLVDTLHQDLRRARAAATAIIPASTGAARAVGLVLPHLKGKIDGTAVRVPTANVSMVDLTAVMNRSTSVDEINTLMRSASTGYLKEVLGVCTEPLVSCDFNHNPLSSIVDLEQTHVVGDNFIRVLSWYDNEWGFANRMCDTARALYETC
ncbi:MAG: type I glyceraldehyde-3-phosphate dehydrogenase [Alphaproteobacteria bacterium]|nr:MAG: type I glyceraldehyde-3-phosphate dehydrogenase [Alphaproteobacteria bacterium]